MIILRSKIEDITTYARYGNDSITILGAGISLLHIHLLAADYVEAPWEGVDVGLGGVAPDADALHVVDILRGTVGVGGDVGYARHPFLHLKIVIESGPWLGCKIKWNCPFGYIDISDGRYIPECTGSRFRGGHPHGVDCQQGCTVTESITTDKVN